MLHRKEGLSPLILRERDKLQRSGGRDVRKRRLTIQVLHDYTPAIAFIVVYIIATVWGLIFR